MPLKRALSKGLKVVVGNFAVLGKKPLIGVPKAGPSGVGFLLPPFDIKDRKTSLLSQSWGYLKYRSLDDYMIGKDRWNREKDQLLERAGLKEFANPQKVLRELDEALYQQYETTTNSNVIYYEANHPFDMSELTLEGLLPKIFLIAQA